MNLTPDSFSDGGQIPTPEAAYRRAMELIAAGADILDLGAESSRPNAQPVTPQEECRRLLPVFKKLKNISIPLSVDTYKPDVARAALDAGASMINDITGLRHPAMRRLAAERKVPVVIMHMQGSSQTMQRAPRYHQVVKDVRQALLNAARQAEAEGVLRRNIILDPGIGFGKTKRHNLQLLGRVAEVVATGYPVLIGTSRKSFIAGVLGDLQPQDREWGTAASVAWAVAQGVKYLRVHNVQAMAMVARMTWAIAREQKSSGRLKKCSKT